MKSLEILEHAERLQSFEETEANLRAVASRAYFAAFQHALEHGIRVGFAPTKTGDDHVSLIQFLKKSVDPRQKAWGYRQLPRLRALRNRADYELVVPFTRPLAEEALEEASDICVSRAV